MSPVIALKMAESLSKQKTPKQLHSYLVENDPWHFTKSNELVRSVTLASQATTYHGDVIERLETRCRG